MSSISSYLSRPFLFLLFLFLVGASFIALRPGYEPQAASILETATRPRETATGTAAPAATIPASVTITLTAEATAPPTATLPISRPTPTPQNTATPTPERIQEHVVQAGQSIDSIAVEYGITAASITALNYLAEPDLLFPGQTLMVPLYANSTPEPALLQALIEAALAESGSEPTVLGYSVLERPIELYTFGDGPNTFIFVGGIHGGYEWNSTVLAYEFIDYFSNDPTAVPEAVTMHIIPAANPDGIFAVTGIVGRIGETDVLSDDTFPARFNANGVDLNRNWDCDWSAAAVWWDEFVNGGTAVYSEVENQILLAFIERQSANLQGVIFWHSSAFLVSPGQCGDAVHQPSESIAQTFAQAARYPVGAFDAYPITGEASNALAQMGIASFSVELSSHEAIDWVRNLAGVRALLAQYDQR